MTIHSSMGLEARSRSRTDHPIGTMGQPTLSRCLKGPSDHATHHRSAHGLHRGGARRTEIGRAIDMSAERPTRTISVTDRSLLRSIQPERPLIGSAPGGSLDGLDRGPVPSPCDQEVRLVMCLLLA